MSQRFDPDLFAGTAAYYARFRAPYGRVAIDHVIAAFRLDRTARVLDLGCGPGTLTIPLAAVAGEVVAMDPDEDMLAEAKRQAAGATNIRWIHGGSLDLDLATGPFRLVVFGQSFHW